uniref:Sushi domain-containing protein n=1 Tax=Crocodylus porosus TaxID=8502 RepID=A0A7M4FNT9_CROPO
SDSPFLIQGWKTWRLWQFYKPLFFCIVPLLLLSGSFLLACPKLPEVPFATIDVDKKEYQPGEEVTYTCRPGYVHHSGMRKYTCNRSGRWFLNTMKCIRK